MAVVIFLNWPDRRLSPNARTHWAVKARAIKAAREAAGWATRASGARVESEGAVTLKITFRPPDRRRRDLDGMFASCKAYFDGIADVLGVNDHRFRFMLEVGEPVKSGSVGVQIEDRQPSA